MYTYRTSSKYIFLFFIIIYGSLSHVRFQQFIRNGVANFNAPHITRGAGEGVVKCSEKVNSKFINT